MTEREKIYFTPKDICCESVLFLLRRGDLLGAVEIVTSGMAYNRAKDGGDPEEIYQAYQRLHFELKLFKKNFLRRGKGHW